MLVVAVEICPTHVKISESVFVLKVRFNRRKLMEPGTGALLSLFFLRVAGSSALVKGLLLRTEKMVSVLSCCG